MVVLKKQVPASSRQNGMVDRSFAVLVGLLSVCIATNCTAQTEPLWEVYSNNNSIYINREGEIVFELPLGYFGDDYAEGRARIFEGFEDEQRYGIIDEKGTIIVEPQYLLTDNYFSEGLMAVEIERDKWGYVDQSGELAIPALYRHMPGSFSDGMAEVMDDMWQSGYIDRSGELVIPYQFEIARDFSEGIAPVMPDYDNKLWLVIDKSGKTLFELSYSNMGSYHEGLARAETASGMKQKTGYVNAKGELVIKQKFLRGGNFHNGLCAASVGPDTDTIDRWGLIDKTGEWVIPPEYSRIYPFTDGFAWVRFFDGKEGYIDREGNLASELYDYAEPFENGLAKVGYGVLGGTISEHTLRTGYINTDFEFVWPKGGKEELQSHLK